MMVPKTASSMVVAMPRAKMPRPLYTMYTMALRKSLGLELDAMAP